VLESARKGKLSYISIPPRGGKAEFKIKSENYKFFYVLHNSQVKTRNQSQKTRGKIVFIDSIK
ncbi:hypothetical protein, partial [Escherichia coli]|uniref:hypothetical protein n=1 Tax=Escherichia coli TaxID=562 RepID=UPI001BFCBE0E